MSTDELRGWVEAARGGDAWAWEQLYRRIHPRLLAYAARRVGPDAVDDVVNDTMTRAVAGIKRFRWEPAGFDAWLFGIARRAAADQHRHAAKARKAAQAGDRSVTAPLPGDALDLAEDHARVRVAFDHLTASDRELLELRVIAGLSAEETGAVLGKSPGTIRTAQSRALARLRIILDAFERQQ